MSWSTVLGLDDDELRDHRTFLLDRAVQHAEAVAVRFPSPKLLAATLSRDAAALSMLLRDYRSAARLLADAAETYSSEGVSYGLLLRAIIGRYPSQREKGTLLAALIEQLGSPEQSQARPDQRYGDDELQPKLGGKAPVDVVPVYQALAGSRVRRSSIEIGEDVGERLFGLVSEAVPRRFGAYRETGPSPTNMQALRTLTDRLKFSRGRRGNHSPAVERGRGGAPTGDRNGAERHVQLEVGP